MEDEKAAERSVQDGVERASDKGSDGNGDQRDGDESDLALALS